MWHNPPRDGGRPLLRYGNTATFMFLNHFCMLFPRFWGPSHASEGHLGLGPCVMRFFRFFCLRAAQLDEKSAGDGTAEPEKNASNRAEIAGVTKSATDLCGKLCLGTPKAPNLCENYETFTYLSKKARARLPTEVCCNQESVGQGSGVGA